MPTLHKSDFIKQKKSPLPRRNLLIPIAVMFLLLFIIHRQIPYTLKAALYSFSRMHLLAERNSKLQLRGTRRLSSPGTLGKTDRFDYCRYSSNRFSKYIHDQQRRHLMVSIEIQEGHFDTIFVKFWNGAHWRTRTGDGGPFRSFKCSGATLDLLRDQLQQDIPTSFGVSILEKSYSYWHDYVWTIWSVVNGVSQAD